MTPPPKLNPDELNNMILTKEQTESFAVVAQPLMVWLHENCHPHCAVIVDSERAEVFEGLAGQPRKEQPKIEGSVCHACDGTGIVTS